MPQLLRNYPKKATNGTDISSTTPVERVRVNQTGEANRKVSVSSTGTKENTSYQPVPIRKARKSPSTTREPEPNRQSLVHQQKKDTKSRTSKRVLEDEESSSDDEIFAVGKSPPQATVRSKKISIRRAPESHSSSDHKMVSPTSTTREPEPNRQSLVQQKKKDTKSRTSKRVLESEESFSDDEIFAVGKSPPQATIATCVSSRSNKISNLPSSSSRRRAPEQHSSSDHEMEEDVHVDNDDDTNIENSSSLLLGTQDDGRRSRERGTGETVSTEPSVTSGSYLSDCSYDPQDPEWLTFASSVKDSPASAHERLASNLLGSPNCAALLGKLIYRSISDINNKESRKLCEKYGVTIIRAILHVSVLNDHKSGHLVELVNLLFTELRHFRTPVLYSIAEYCLNYMKNDKDRDGSLPPRWIEIFGKIVSVLITRGDIKHETDVMDGKAYKSYIITEMCGSRLKWTPDNTASLIAIIREIPGIDDNELKIIMVHVRSSLKEVRAAALPPIVNQLILLAGNRRPSELLSVCAEYFKHVDFTNMDSLEVKQKRNALGTVVYHFLDAARTSDTLVKAVIKVVKASFFDFEKIMSPFTLSVVLGLTTYEHAKAGIIDPLRNSVMKSFHSLYLCESSYWYRHKVRPDVQDTVTECFKAVLETKSSEIEIMFEGLRELGIGLLNADLYQSKYPNTLERCQKLGSYLITSIVKSDSMQLPSMMKHLLKISSKSIVHTECLAKCLEMRTRQVIQPNVIGKTCEIIRHLPMMDSTSAAMIVKALSNAFNLSYILLDQLMLNLRKTIWKSVEARRTASKIMIILLSNSRVVGDVPFSQYSESQRFYNDSQNQQLSAPGQLPDNQPLCIEILTLAKRCFSQQCEIREELYLGFHSVVRKNPGLCELICSQLYNHTNQYLSENLNTSGPDTSETTLLFTKVVELPVVNNASGYVPVTIKEELGFLVQCLSFVVHKSHQAFHSIDDGPPLAVEQLEKLLQQWINVILKMTCETVEIAAAGVVTEAGGGSRPLETVRYVETIFTIQIMQVIEALIEFLNLENKPKNDRIVKRLFDKYGLIKELLKKEKEKVGSKKGKGDKDKTKGKASQKGGKSKDVTADDVMIVDDASETSENPAGGVKFKKPDAPKRLLYFHILTLESTLDMFHRVQRCNEEKGAVGRVPREDLEKFLLSTVKQKFTNFKRKEPLHERSRPTQKVLEMFANVAGCLWNSLLASNSEEEESVDVTSLDMIELKLEIINEIVSLLCSSHPSICTHLIKIFSDDDSEASYDVVFPKFFNSWKTVYGWIPANEDDDKDRAVHQYLFEILNSFAKPLTPDFGNHNRAGEVTNWLWNEMSSSSGKRYTAEFLLAEAMVSCWLAYYMKGRDFLGYPDKPHHDIVALSMGVKQALGVWEEVDTQVDPVKIKLWVINTDTAPTILCTIMYHIELILDHIMAVLAKLKFNQNDDSDNLNQIGVLRGSCFTKIDEILKVCSQLVMARFPAGLCCTTMLKVIPQIFNVMTGFGDYFFELIKTKRPYSLRGYAKPVAEIGKDFKPLVEGMINHIERVQREHADDICKQAMKNKNNKTKGPGKVPQAVKNQLLKEKKLIPNFVYLIEKYDQLIIALSKKSDKHKLLVGMKLSTARDFKIRAEKLTEAIDSGVRSVQQISTVPDDETRMEGANNVNDTSSAGPSTARAAPRIRKGRKRKPSERDEEGIADNAE